MAEMTDPQRLRSAAAWFDTVDKLLSILVVTVTATGETYKLIDKLKGGTEIQDDLLRIADELEGRQAQMAVPLPDEALEAMGWD